MHTLSIHLHSLPKNPKETILEKKKREARIKANTRILNELLQDGFNDAFNVDPIQNTITHFHEKEDNIVRLCEKTVWVVQDFEELPLEIITKIDKIAWVTYTLQKKLTPSSPEP